MVCHGEEHEGETRHEERGLSVLVGKEHTDIFFDDGGDKGRS